MKRALILLTVIIMAASFSFAGEKGGWWQSLKSKAEKLAPTKKATTTTAVGGVRGAKDESADALYWKGRKDNVSKAEFEKFNLAVEHALNGNTEKSLKTFEEFLKEYPRSPLASDAKTALKRLRGE